MSEIAIGAVEDIAATILVNGTVVSSSAVVTATVQRASDGLWLNTSTETFGAFDAFTVYRTLDVDPDATGRYSYAWDTSTITNPHAGGDVYTVTCIVSAPFTGEVVGTIRTTLIPAVRSGLALASALATVQSGINALTSGLSALSGVVTTVRKRLTNRAELDSSGILRRYDDDATTVIATSTIRDYQGNAITLSAGEPARTSAES